MSNLAQTSSTLEPSEDKVIFKSATNTRSPLYKRRTYLNSDDIRRDSGLAPSMTASNHEATSDIVANDNNNNNTMTTPNNALNGVSGNGTVPAIKLNDDSRMTLPGMRNDASASYTTLSRKSSAQASLRDVEPNKPAPATTHFRGLSTEIPTGEMDDVFRGDGLEVSRRGSLRRSGQARKTDNAVEVNGCSPNKKPTSGPTARYAASKHNPSFAERRESQKLRSLYECGDENAALSDESPTGPNTQDTDIVPALPTITAPKVQHELGSPNGSRPVSSLSSKRASYIKMEPWEAAGGIDDWRNIDSRDVDQYGFIKPRNLGSRVSSMNSGSHPGTPNSGINDHQRASPNPSSLDAVDEGSVRPRKLRRPPPDAARPYRLSMLSRESISRNSMRPQSRSTPTPSITSTRSRLSIIPSSLGSSRTPRNRKFAREAPSMLTSEPGLPENAAVSPPEPRGAELKALRARDRRHEAKWGVMAKRSSITSSNKNNNLGGGDSYVFDTHSPKLISRTWKGIPDKWRRPAWHSFLTTSAKRRAVRTSTRFIPDSELIASFHVHQETDYADDVQIDMDVPRTIGHHLSFHVRYRGGQRLLFRVLHALALEFPAVGYVQGMAPLVATLLIYYDDERAFVVACRLWECRGLAKLFSPGFGGLMEELDVFKQDWLGGPAGDKEVLQRLEGLGIEPMTFAVKWYLTLFAYSLPFEAQLRVWDVFMLLGGGEGGVDGEGTRSTASTGKKEEDKQPHEFDVLHAVGAALMDALADRLRKAEFEGAMALLTGHVPAGRGDVLMRVAKGEWKARGKKS